MPYPWMIGAKNTVLNGKKHQRQRAVGVITQLDIPPHVWRGQQFANTRKAFFNDRVIGNHHDVIHHKTIQQGIQVQCNGDDSQGNTQFVSFCPSF